MKKSLGVTFKAQDPSLRRSFNASYASGSVKAQTNKGSTFGKAAAATGSRTTKSVSPKRKIKFGKNVPKWVYSKNLDVKVADLSEFLRVCSIHKDFTKEVMVEAFLKLKDTIYKLQSQDAETRNKIEQTKREYVSLLNERDLLDMDLAQIERFNSKDRAYIEEQEKRLGKGLGIPPKSEAGLQDTLKSISQSKTLYQEDQELKKSFLKQPVTMNKENEFLARELQEIDKEIISLSASDYSLSKMNELLSMISNEPDDEESKTRLLEILVRHRKVLESRLAQKDVEQEKEIFLANAEKKDLNERIEEMERLVQAKTEENTKKEKMLQELEAQEEKIQKKLANLQKSPKYKLTGVKAGSGKEYNFLVSSPKRNQPQKGKKQPIQAKKPQS